MLEEEIEDFILPSDIYEVDIERYRHIAEAYGVMVVPTLVAGGHSISGLPTASDLRTFLMQSFPGLTQSDSEKSRRKVLHKMKRLLKEQREELEQRVISPLKN